MLQFLIVLNFNPILFFKFLIFKLRKPKRVAPVASRASLWWLPCGQVLWGP